MAYKSAFIGSPTQCCLHMFGIMMRFDDTEWSVSEPEYGQSSFFFLKTLMGIDKRNSVNLDIISEEL